MLLKLRFRVNSNPTLSASFSFPFFSLACVFAEEARGAETAGAIQNHSHNLLERQRPQGKGLRTSVPRWLTVSCSLPLWHPCRFASDDIVMIEAEGPEEGGALMGLSDDEFRLRTTQLF
jgi:hypothetical protein